MSTPVDPQTPAEWQEAVNAASFCLAIDSCFQYGLLESVNVDEVTGRRKPGRASKKSGVNVQRCLEIIERGRAKGIHPEPLV